MSLNRLIDSRLSWISVTLRAPWRFLRPRKQTPTGAPVWVPTSIDPDPAPILDP